VAIILTDFHSFLYAESYRFDDVFVFLLMAKVNVLGEQLETMI